ncbi:hypothetical protein [Corynebacterium caspium]|uniref:hypothetical protein n=1 Tax=Corynebacterium caspium TaxID=234828 RepID=UPI00035D091F|nr:hypothetical protein [Corynebacterium caspium]WKD59499.1 hypothetical protein CCASP_05560 [Corynebacterium caspium DSM 44850]
MNTTLLSAPVAKPEKSWGNRLRPNLVMGRGFKPGKLIAGILALSMACGLGACSSGESELAENAGAAAGDKPLVIVAPASSPDQIVMAYLYAENLEQHRYPTLVRIMDENPAAGADVAPGASANTSSWFLDTEIDVVVSCTGYLLNQGSPAQARDLAAENTSGSTTQDPIRAVYEAAIGTLPAAFDITDPSPTQGCYEQQAGAAKKSVESPELPENIVAVFRKTAIDRYGRKHLNDVSRLITAADLEELTKDFKAGEDIKKLAVSWHAANVN